MRLIYKIVPVPIIETNRFIPRRFGAMSLGLFVLIRPAYRNDEALIAHELTHCRQFYRTAGLHAPLYWLSDRYRYAAEREAYAVQALAQSGGVRTLGEKLARDYGFGVSVEQARRDIEREMEVL